MYSVFNSNEQFKLLQVIISKYNKVALKNPSFVDQNQMVFEHALIGLRWNLKQPENAYKIDPRTVKCCFVDTTVVCVTRDRFSRSFFQNKTFADYVLHFKQKLQCN